MEPVDDTLNVVRLMMEAEARHAETHGTKPSAGATANTASAPANQGSEPQRDLQPVGVQNGERPRGRAALPELGPAEEPLQLYPVEERPEPEIETRIDERPARVGLLSRMGGLLPRRKVRAAEDAVEDIEADSFDFEPEIEEPPARAGLLSRMGRLLPRRKVRAHEDAVEDIEADSFDFEPEVEEPPARAGLLSRMSGLLPRRKVRAHEDAVEDIEADSFDFEPEVDESPARVGLRTRMSGLLPRRKVRAAEDAETDGFEPEPEVGAASAVTPAEVHFVQLDEAVGEKGRAAKDPSEAAPLTDSHSRKRSFVQAVKEFRPTRKQIALAVFAGIMLWRPWLIPGLVFVIFWVSLIGYLTLGPDRVAEIAQSRWEWFNARYPDRAARVLGKMQRGADRMEGWLARLPERWTDGIYMPDLGRSEIEGGPKNTKPDPFDRLAAEQQAMTARG